MTNWIFRYCIGNLNHIIVRSKRVVLFDLNIDALTINNNFINNQSDISRFPLACNSNTWPYYSLHMYFIFELKEKCKAMIHKKCKYNYLVLERSQWYSVKYPFGSNKYLQLFSRYIDYQQMCYVYYYEIDFTEKD